MWILIRSTATQFQSNLFSLVHRNIVSLIHLCPVPRDENIPLDDSVFVVRCHEFKDGKLFVKDYHNVKDFYWRNPKCFIIVSLTIER